MGNRSKTSWFTGLCLLLISHAALAEIIRTSNAELEALMDQGVTLIDVRRADEWNQTGVIASSKLITFFDRHGNYDAKSWMESVGSHVKSGDPIALICQTGYRSTVLSHWLTEELGFQKVYNVSGGIYGWKHAGKALVAPEVNP